MAYNSTVPHGLCGGEGCTLSLTRADLAALCRAGHDHASTALEVFEAAFVSFGFGHFLAGADAATGFTGREPQPSKFSTVLFLETGQACWQCFLSVAWISEALCRGQASCFWQILSFMISATG